MFCGIFIYFWKIRFFFLFLKIFVVIFVLRGVRKIKKKKKRNHFSEFTFNLIIEKFFFLFNGQFIVGIQIFHREFLWNVFLLFYFIFTEDCKMKWCYALIFTSALLLISTKANSEEDDGIVSEEILEVSTFFI